MKSIKGPRSALSNFIEESGIKLQSNRTIKKSDAVQSKVVEKRTKKVRYQKPAEIVNHDRISPSLEDICISNILNNINMFTYTDSQLNLISMYICRNRLMNSDYFYFLLNNCKEELYIYDCSMIKDAEYLINKKLKKLELFLCGQITENSLNSILDGQDSLEVLRITGAYLIENIELPRSLKVLDLTNCSRISNNLIGSINKTYERLEELRLSFCYNLTDDVQLEVDIERLFICETTLSPVFYQKAIQNVRQLSIKRCPKINEIPSSGCLEYIDIEGMVTLKELHLPKSIEYIDASYCYNINSFQYPNLTYLNVSYINLNIESIKEICKNKKLKILDLSWNNNLDDKTLQYIVDNLHLNTLIVFGCFGLSQESARLAWKMKDRLEIVGSPAETLFLLNND